MSSRPFSAISRVLTLTVAILDLILSVYFLIAAFISYKQNDYINYRWQWNVFYLTKIVATSLMLYGVIKNNRGFMIVGTALNGVVLGVLLYLISAAKFKYMNCERDLCRGESSNTCFSCDGRNYLDYDYTSKWGLFMIIEIIVFIVCIIVGNKKSTREHFPMRTTV